MSELKDMNEVARIITTSRGPVCLVKDTLPAKDGGPDLSSILLYFSLPGVGTCRIKAQFENSDEGYELRDKAFDESTPDTALSMIEGILERFDGHS